MGTSEQSQMHPRPRGLAIVLTVIAILAVGAAFRQVENIRFIQKEVGLEILPDKLREIAELRVKHQDVTLKELGEMVTGGAISKSGINHRLRKIDQIADKLRDGKPIS